jgi:signal transduction histidine kinase
LKNFKNFSKFIQKETLNLQLNSPGVLKRVNLLSCVLLLIFTFLTQFGISQTTKYNLLYINSYNLGYNWSDSIYKGIEKALNHKNISIYIENLDAKRFGQKNFEIFTHSLREKYKSTHFDAIITSDNDALDYMIEYGSKLYPNVPVTFCGIKNPEDYNFEGRRIYGFIESTNPMKTVGVLINLLPEAKSLLFITDNTTTGTVIKPDYDNIRKLFPSIKVNFISDIDEKEILKIIKKGDQGDIVYLLRINRDKYGNMLDYMEFFKEITKVSPNPVFADEEAMMGHGVVGGNANRGYNQGYRAGELAFKLLKNPDLKVPHINRVEDEYIFDHKQLVRFKISKKNLPQGSVIINKPVFQYIGYITGLAIIIILLLATVIFLVVLNTKKRKAELKVKEQMAEINNRNTLLEQSYHQLSDLNHDLEEANNQLYNLNISLKEAKQKAEESERLKSSFLANLSHEIRTPLNAILGFSSLLLEPDLREGAQENYFNIIQSNSESLLILIDDILDFSKIEAGQIQVHLEEIMINEILEELYISFNQRTLSKSVQMRLNDAVRKTTVKMLTDKTRFKQIFTNLLTNALKFTEEGYIEFGFRVVNPLEIQFYVKDTGIGIDKKFHKAIFERFRKVEDSTRFYSGSGLGLAICKKLTEMLGGKIWVEGDKGIGSTFYFTHSNFTVIENEENKNRQESKTDTNYDWKGKVIAIAEDEDTNYWLLEQLLIDHKAEIIRFKDGESIVDYFTNKDISNISLILMDIKMPVMDGFKAFEEIKKLYPHMIIIAQTAYAMNDDIAVIKEKGFDDYISKPINTDRFKETMNKYLNNL